MVSPPDESLGKSVLIVDTSPESREVLRTVLQRRGLRIIETDRGEQTLDLIRQHRPDVTVLDFEAIGVDDAPVCQALDEQHGGSLVVLGSTKQHFPGLPSDRHVSKPYHFAPLVRKIEGVIEQAVRSA